MKNVLLLCLVLTGLCRAHALDEPKPVDFLASVEGEWTGTLTYRDYSPPYGLVTLPTTLYASLSGPDELTLHYIYDDGPGKTVHSYERLQVDLPAKTIRWSSLKAGDSTVCRIVDCGRAATSQWIVAEREESTGGKPKLTRYTLRFGADRFENMKQEGAGAEPPIFRDGYTFARREKN